MRDVRINSYTPKHLRRRGNATKNGSGAVEKSRMFRATAQRSKRFIFESASRLESPALNADYVAWCRDADAQRLRKSTSK